MAVVGGTSPGDLAKILRGIAEKLELEDVQAFEIAVMNDVHEGPPEGGWRTCWVSSRHTIMITYRTAEAGGAR